MQEMRSHQATSEFYEQNGMKDGHRHNCKECHSAAHKEWYAQNRDEEIARVKRWQQENKDRVNEVSRRRRAERGDEYKRKEREGHLLRKYGIRIRDFETLLYAQMGFCAICGRNERHRLHVDHDHETGVVRGLLCGKCNKAIGLLDDEPRLLRSAEDYLVAYRRVFARRRPPRHGQRRPSDDRSKQEDE
jgi:Recombination endonuclease VII